MHLERQYKEIECFLRKNHAKVWGQEMIIFHKYYLTCELGCLESAELASVRQERKFYNFGKNSFSK